MTCFIYVVTDSSALRHSLSFLFLLTTDFIDRKVLLLIKTVRSKMTTIKHPVDISESIEACAAHYGKDANAMKSYLLEGQRKALAMDNRGPLKFEADGSLATHIKDAYSKYGFYIFEGLISDKELADLEQDIERLKTQFPLKNGEKLNAQGEKALASDALGPRLIWSKPLGDPLGGTPIANGRHQVKLFEPCAAKDAPEEAVFVLLGSLEYSDACLRAYAHPELLKVAESINGKDFAPFHECLFIKEPGLGAAVSWHQDGDTHWNSPDFDEGIHGFNFMAQVYGSTAVNGVWVVPGTHKQGKLDIKEMVAQAGSERLTEAVPIICNAGDVVICNRQIVHGSFANTGFEPRVTVNFGFHRRSSVLNVSGAGIHCASQEFDDEHIAKRTAVLGYAIDARMKKYPEETPYVYALFANSDTQFEYNNDTKEALKDYNLLDLSI